MSEMDDGRLEEELKAGRTVAIPTRGISMQPLLYENKTIAVLQPITHPPKRGDVVLYRRDSGLFVLHRMISARNGVYQIRGDNCYYIEQVRPDQLRGVMTEFVRGGRTIRATDGRYRCYAWLRMADYPLRAVLHRFPVRKWPYYLTHLPMLLFRKITQNRSSR